ncbi:MAG: tetratricopeptide repeat-containing sulfotransferase family protein [Limisphaerales bacterium]
MKLKRQSLVSPGSISRMLQAAEQAWKRRDFKQNLELLERASRLDPANPAILLQLGRSHGLGFDYAAAEQCFERAVRVAPRKTEALATAGIHSRDFRNPELAERYFRRAVEQKDAPPETLIYLAELYERLRRNADAAQLIDRALQLNCACPMALLARARLERQTGQLAEAEKRLRAMPKTADRDTRVRSLYELGAILDRQGRYDEAMTAFLDAKALLRPDAERWLAELMVVRDRLKVMRANISPDLFRKWFETGPALAPARRIALLCGHPRSGTTLLEQVLDSHPDMVSAEETEIFHDYAYIPLMQGLPEGERMLPVLEAAQADRLLESRDNYFRQMELLLGQTIKGRLLIDKNPSLTYFIPALVRVFPEIKLLIALRDPRDVVMSCFMQAFVPIGQVTVAYLTLEGTVDEYAALVGIWQTLAPLLQGHYLQVRYEDMVEDLESVSRKTLDFLGVPWDAGVLKFDEHARHKQVRSPTYADVAKPVFKTAVGRWRNYQKYLEPYLHRLEPFVKAFGYG